MAFTVRPARSEELPEILGLHDLLHDVPDAAPREPDASERSAWQRIQGSDDHHVLVACDDAGRIVGSIDLIVVANLTRGGRPFGLVENVVVSSAHRRLGIGRRLIEEAATCAREAGCYKIQLLSHPKRQDAHAFYESVGLDVRAIGFRLYFDDALSAFRSEEIKE